MRWPIRIPAAAVAAVLWAGLGAGDTPQLIPDVSGRGIADDYDDLQVAWSPAP